MRPERTCSLIKLTSIREGLLDRFGEEAAEFAEANTVAGVSSIIGVREIRCVDVTSEANGLVGVAGVHDETDVMGVR